MHQSESLNITYEVQIFLKPVYNAAASHATFVKIYLIQGGLGAELQINFIVLLL